MEMWDRRILLGIAALVLAFILTSAVMFWLSLIEHRGVRVTTSYDHTSVSSIPARSGKVASPQISPTVENRETPSIPRSSGPIDSPADGAIPPRSGDAASPQISATVENREEPSTPRSLIPIDSPADGEMALDLLRIGDATTVQQRLADLGFFGGPPNGIWTPRSRQALREFKAMNDLPRDDIWDAQTRTRVFASNAKKMTVSRVGTNERHTEQDPDSNYPPPPGTTLNPLNNADAVNLQKRLAELGFLVGKIDGVWGQASRNALQDFKMMSSLTADDQWDVITESTLKADRPVRATETFIGGWAEEVVDCKPANAGGAPLRISVRQAEKGGTVCKFGPALREGSAWRLQAVCAGEGKTWNANISLSVSGDHLTWSSERGTDSFVRCRGR